MTSLPERLVRSRDPLPNLRGEDETELSYLTNLIESELIRACTPLLSPPISA